MPAPRYDASVHRDALELRAAGLSYERIAARLGLPKGAVRGIVVPTKPRTGGRLGLRGRTRCVREHVANGLTPAELAARYGIDEAAILRSLAGERRSRALPAEEKARRKAERSAEAEARKAERTAARARAKWFDEVSPAEPWRYRDPKAPAQACAEDLGDDQVVELPAIAEAELVDARPVVELEPEPWDGPISPHADAARPPRVLTPDVVARVLELREQGRSWRAIARELGMHRQTLYHAERAGRLVATPLPPPSPAPAELVTVEERAGPPLADPGGNGEDW